MFMNNFLVSSISMTIIVDDGIQKQMISKRNNSDYFQKKKTMKMSFNKKQPLIFI